MRYSTPGFGRMQIVILFVCGAITMTVLTETMGMGLIMTAAQCDMELSAVRKGIISSMTIAGMFYIIMFIENREYWKNIIAISQAF